MTKESVQNQYEILDRTLRESAQPSNQQYILRLYVTGASRRSQRAITNIKRICEEHLKGHYRLEVVDVYQRPVLAKGEQIVATPTLIKLLPTPLRRIIGDMSRTNQVLLGLDLRRETR
jgi:circadian clock protein KaiB